MTIKMKSTASLPSISRLGAFLFVVGALGALFSGGACLSTKAGLYTLNSAVGWAASSLIGVVVSLVGCLLFSIGRKRSRHR